MNTEASPWKHTGRDLSVGDAILRKTRLLSAQCDTCIFKPGNPMHLAPGRLAEMVREARANEGFIVCHDTLPYGHFPDAKPAICRGFHDRYSTQALQVIEQLWGFVEVDPPHHDPAPADQRRPSPPPATPRT